MAWESGFESASHLRAGPGKSLGFPPWPVAGSQDSRRLQPGAVAAPRALDPPQLQGNGSNFTLLITANARGASQRC